jgi:hypothetical protein
MTIRRAEEAPVEVAVAASAPRCQDFAAEVLKFVFVRGREVKPIPPHDGAIPD